MDRPIARKRPERHAALERYLCLATCGLWGQKRREVRQELEGNIREMALEFEIAGHSQHEAITLALKEFGAPEKVSLGMAKVYVVPNMTRTILLTGILGAVGISTLNSSGAQIASEIRIPLPECQDLNAVTFQAGGILNGCANAGLWFKLSSLRSALEPLGVKIATINQFEYPYGDYSVTFPGGKPVTWGAAPGGRVSMIAAHNGEPEGRNIKTLDQNAIQGAYFFSSLTSSGLPIHFVAGTPSQLSIGSTTVKLGTKENPISPQELQTAMLFDPLEGFFPNQLVRNSDMWEALLIDQQLSWANSQSVYQYKIHVKGAQPDAVHYVLSRDDRKDFKGLPVFPSSTATIRRVERLGASYETMHQQLEFIDNTDAKQPLEPLGKDIFISNAAIAQGKFIPKNPNQVMLVEFTGRLDQETFRIVPPDQITSERLN